MNVVDATCLCGKWDDLSDSCWRAHRSDADTLFQCTKIMRQGYTCFQNLVFYQYDIKRNHVYLRILLSCIYLFDALIPSLRNCRTSELRILRVLRSWYILAFNSNCHLEFGTDVLHLYIWKEWEWMLWWRVPRAGSCELQEVTEVTEELQTPDSYHPLKSYNKIFMELRLPDVAMTP